MCNSPIVRTVHFISWYEHRKKDFIDDDCRAIIKQRFAVDDCGENFRSA